MSSRNMSLLPRATLHSDSEQVSSCLSVTANTMKIHRAKNAKSMTFRRRMKNAVVSTGFVGKHKYFVFRERTLSKYFMLALPLTSLDIVQYYANKRLDNSGKSKSSDRFQVSCFLSVGEKYDSVNIIPMIFI
jgi:hypothetical protein